MGIPAALYAYPWDVAEKGAGAITREFRALGVQGISLALAYHAGKFMRPTGTSGKVVFPEDGTVSFRTTISRYGRVRPQPTSLLVSGRDVLRDLTDIGGLAVHGWMVLLHNSRIGLSDPELCVENAFGDRYIYSLCPAHPDNRAFAVALVADAGANNDLASILVETPGFLPYQHGYHHEFSLMRHNQWLDNRLGLCFCDHCLARADAAGVDGRKVKADTAQAISAYLASDVDYPADMAQALWLADVATDPDLQGYLRMRNEAVTSLVLDIRAALRPEVDLRVIPSVDRPTGKSWVEGTDLAALSRAGIGIEACFYEPSAARVAADLFDVQRRTGNAQLTGILRPAFPDLEVPGEFVAAVEVLKAAGLARVSFYNYGHLRARDLRRIRDATAILAS